MERKIASSQKEENRENFGQEWIFQFNLDFPWFCFRMKNLNTGILIDLIILQCEEGRIHGS